MSDNQHNFAVWLLKNCDSYSKNTKERFDSYGNSTGHYHVQKKQQFSSPAHALAYIYRHEKAIIKYLMGDGGNETYCPDGGNV